MLETVPPRQRVAIVTDDGDFRSKIHNEKINPFLKEEWTAAKDVAPEFYRSPSDFFVRNVPEVRFGDEINKEELIRQLADSPNFRTTRSLIRQLRRLSELTNAQMNELVLAALTNNQIHWIASDPDIKLALRALTSGRENQIALRERGPFLAMLDGEEWVYPPPEDDLPF